MGRNTHHTAQIRISVYGREVREPIAKSIEKTISDSDETLNGLVEKHNYRVANASTSEVSGEPGYYQLTFTRANRT